MKLPPRMLPHRMTVEDRIGSDGGGHLYGPPRQLACYVESKQSSRRMPDGRIVVSSSVIRCDLDRSIRPESRLTVFGEAAEIIGVTHYEFPGAPSHTEVMVQ